MSLVMHGYPLVFKLRELTTPDGSPPTRQDIEAAIKRFASSAVIPEQHVVMIELQRAPIGPVFDMSVFISTDEAHQHPVNSGRIIQRIESFIKASFRGPRHS